ncbi:calcium-binding protein, partial [Phyllobacterium endophyticum]|uniref:calcium-binding protein n=1 Tax=Phyllobacterium endophyticum TaxID=1149773 RepID=UPI0011C874FE
RDTIHGGAGDDKLDGGDGNDIILGQAGADELNGGFGDDILSGGNNRDVVRGGDGNDTVIGDADQVADQYDGGPGRDTLDYTAAQNGSMIDLAAGTASSEEIGEDTFSPFEVLLAGAGQDEIQGSERAEEIHGNGGNDRIDGAGGADVVSGGEGADQLSDGAGADTVSGNNGDDTVTAALDTADDTYDGGEGIDTLDYSAALMSVVIDVVAAKASGAEIGTDRVTNFEVINAGAGADEIDGGTASESIFGNAGDDVISGGSGNDTLSGGAGNDVIADGEGADCVLAGTGDDVVLAAADGSNDTYCGEDGIDTLDYSQSAQGVLVNLRTGAATGFDIGHDSISGFEEVVGGTGNDRMIVGTTAVVLEGGGGADTFEFNIPEGSSSAEVIHQILDFMVGDRIEMSRYEIFEDVIDTLEDRFEDTYGAEAGAQPLPIRVRHEGTDELQKTLIEVDMDRDEHYEMTINLTGHHMLMVVENT